jgi:hypothetical protein
MITREELIERARKEGWAGYAMVVSELPKCDAMGCGETAVVRGATDCAIWANMCIRHYREIGLGIGPEIGQVLVLKSELPKQMKSTMKLVNLTPHPIVLMAEGSSVEVPPSGFVARAKEKKELVGILGDKDVSIPLYRVLYGELGGLPKIDQDTYYIVSSLAAQAIKAHLPPYVAERFVVVTDPVRDEEGRVVGARGLALI